MIFAEEETISKRGKPTWESGWPVQMLPEAYSKLLSWWHGTNYEIVLGCKLHEIASHRKKSSTHHTIVQPPLDQFHGRNAEEQFHQQSDKEGIGDKVRCNVIVCGEHLSIGEVYSEADSIREGGQAVSGEGQPFLDIVSGWHPTNIVIINHTSYLGKLLKIITDRMDDRVLLSTMAYRPMCSLGSLLSWCGGALANDGSCSDDWFS